MAKKEKEGPRRFLVTVVGDDHWNPEVRGWIERPAGTTADQAGWYDCRVTDACGAVISDAAHLVINTGAGAGRGDLNCDGAVDFNDINPFVLALSLGETEYYNQYPSCHFYNADTDSNGAVDFGDINPFVACLSAGSCP